MSAGEFEIQPGERVLWAGEPVRRPAFTQGDLLLVPFGLVCVVAAGLLLAQHKAGTTMLLLVVLLAFGLVLAVGRPFVRYLALGKTTYAVTDSRIITKSGLFRQRESTHELAGLDAPVCRRGKSGTGTITFGGSQVVLAGIGQPARVRDLLVKAIEEARGRAGVSPEPDASEPSTS
jgi:hypothetical protein